jgi:ferric-dicitrate binding protein FerR (iron transport regulator)
VNAENEKETMQAMETYMHRTLAPDPFPDEFTNRMFDEFMRERTANVPVRHATAASTRRASGNIVPLHRRRWFNFLAGAATTAAVLLVGYVVMFRYADRAVAEENDMASVAPPMMTAEAPEGGSREVVLPDNTKVRLNSGGKLSWPQQFAADERRVKLEGEGRFDVQSDPLSRFLVQTPTMEVGVFGTVFDVNDNATEKTGTVTLYEGSIEVNIGDNIHKLVPGERLVHHHDTDEIVVAAIATPVNGSSDEIAVKMKTLPEIMAVLSGFYGVSITFDGATLPPGRYSIGFDRGDTPEGVLNVLSLICGGFRFEKQPDGAIIIF